MRYGVLFEIALHHDFWLNLGPVVHEALTTQTQARLRRLHAKNRYADIRPTAATRDRLAGHGMLFKTTETGCLVGVQLEGSSNAPRRPLAAGESLDFMMRIIDPLFFNFTAAALPRFHHFSNTSGNEHEGRVFLSRPVPPHEPARAYVAGEIRSTTTGSITSLFQAVSDTGPSAAPVVGDWTQIPADTHDPTASYQKGALVLKANEFFEARIDGPGTDLGNATEWSKLGSLANQYMTHQDAIELRPQIFDVDVATAAANTLELRVSRLGSTFASWQRRFESSQPLLSIQADLRGLKDGTYRLEVLDSALVPVPNLGFDFFLSNAAVAENWFGVVEIHPGAGNFALLDASGNLRTPRFDLRFLNQASRWRYHFPAAQAAGTGAEVTAQSPDQRVLATPAPRPMTHAGLGARLRADDTTTPSVSEEVLLPNPSPRTLRKQGQQWFSEVHLSNLPKTN